MGLDARPRAIALMGPTASGKSAYAIELARRYGGEIVSVDSALVYRGLDIGAAKPTREEQARAPHHLIDLREPWQPYSAAEFAGDAQRAIDGIVARGRLPILAGGTGLYFRALLEGLSDMPEADEAMRAAITAEADARGWFREVTRANNRTWADFELSTRGEYRYAMITKVGPRPRAA